MAEDKKNAIFLKLERGSKRPKQIRKAKKGGIRIAVMWRPKSFTAHLQRWQGHRSENVSHRAVS